MEAAQVAPTALNRSRPSWTSPAVARPTFSLYRGEAPALLAREAGLIMTPNLDHLRLLSLSKALRRAYGQADVVLNDSRFLDKLAIGGRALCLPGSELAPNLLCALDGGARVFVIGGGGAVQAFLANTYPKLTFSFCNPSMGYVWARNERRRIAAEVLAARPDCVFVCTGAPQSELMAAQLKRAGCAATILCCGSAFNFLSGAKRRAPKAFQRLGAEWLWRFAGEAHTRKRYFADAVFLAANLTAVLALRFRGEARFAGYQLRAG